MSHQEAKQILRRINELHFELHPEPLTEEDIKKMEAELTQKLTGLRHGGFPVALIHADFLTSCGRYILLDDIQH